MLKRKVQTLLSGACTVAALACFLPTSPGCGDRDEAALTKKSMALTELPKPVADAASKTLRGVKLSEAWSNHDQNGNLVSFEVRGTVTSSGKIREVRVSTSGAILEEE
jgi:hypothetical protein